MMQSRVNSVFETLIGSMESDGISLYIYREKQKAINKSNFPHHVTVFVNQQWLLADVKQNIAFLYSTFFFCNETGRSCNNSRKPNYFYIKIYINLSPLNIYKQHQ